MVAFLSKPKNGDAFIGVDLLPEVVPFLDRDGMFDETAQPPKSYGACADLYHDVREIRLQLKKLLEGGLEKLESALKEHLIAGLSKSDDTGAAGKRYRAQIVTKETYKVNTDPEADGWGVFHSWVRKNDRFDMLQKRLSDKAVADWHAENPGRIMPGLEKINLPDVSIRKI